MGNHSNKKPKVKLGLTQKFSDLVGSIPPITVSTSDLHGQDFNFQSGDLSKVHRLVQRRKLKDRVKFLEFLIKTHRPLVHALQTTQKAYQEGVMEGIRQVAAAEREKEQAQAQKEAAQGPTIDTLSPTQEDVPVKAGTSDGGRVSPLPLSRTEPCEESCKTTSN